MIPDQILREFSYIFFQCPINLLRNFHVNLKAISELFFGPIFFLKGFRISSIKLKANSQFFIARYLTVSLRGPVLTLRRGAVRRVVRVGRVGRMGR